MTILLGVLSGGIGATARYLVSGAVQHRSRLRFPLGTMVVNLMGSLAIGVAAGLTSPGSGGRALLAGALAGFTTFSTWSFESLSLMRTGRHVRAALNLLPMMLAGVLLCALGYHLAD